MTSNTSSGQIDRDSNGSSIDSQPAEKRFSSLTDPQSQEILNLASRKGWTTDRAIQQQLKLTDVEKRESLIQLTNDHLIELVGTTKGQFVRVTDRGKWATDIQTDVPTAGENQKGQQWKRFLRPASLESLQALLSDSDGVNPIFLSGSNVDAEKDLVGKNHQQESRRKGDWMMSSSG